MLTVENIGEFGESILIRPTFTFQCFTVHRISHAIRVKVSDPVNLAINIGEKVREEVGLNFKMKSTSTSWIILIRMP